MTLKASFALVGLALILVACSAPATVTEKFYFVRGTAVGDPCSPNGTMIDTPRGYPRLCHSGKWAPLCDATNNNADVMALCEEYGLQNAAHANE